MQTLGFTYDEIIAVLHTMPEAFAGAHSWVVAALVAYGYPGAPSEPPT